MTRNWPVQITAEDLLRQMDRRITRSERRATPIASSDLLGPGMSSQAVQILDWNDEIATFNGFFYSLAGAHNIPVVEVYDYDPVTGMPEGEPEEIDDLPWTGCVIAREDGSGMQQVWNTDEPESMFFRVRNYWPNPDDPDAPVIFGEWQRFATPTGWIEGDDLAPPVRDGITTIYETAEQAALDAEEAAATATTALASANGKNTVWYSTSAPGSTPNTAGDIWFQKDPSTQTITHQFSGLGGTSWTEVQITNAVIANLDAGKLTAGSAFTNALSVKTLFTLGDASTNGIIQSYNFAGSSTGIYIDKSGFIAKGGSITGATVTASTFQTDTSNSRIVISPSSPVTEIRLYYLSEGSPARISNIGANRLSLTTGPGEVGMQIGPTQIQTDVPLIVDGSLQSTTFSTGAATFNGNLTMNFANIIMGGFSIQSVGAINNGGLDINMDATIKPDECFLTSVPSSGTAGTVVHMGASGRLYRFTSTARHKDNIRDPQFDLRPLKTVPLREFTYRPEYTDTPDRVVLGGIAEEWAETDMNRYVVRGEDGQPDAIDTLGLVYPIILWLRELEQRLLNAGL